ncbi:acetyl-CoA C-acyltransferase [Zoogloeaceae bacterium G21618-S1]|nr:acetyl-CoA C-acyltransferase [Zoogloeaceae bacterium G21618-S1]
MSDSSIVILGARRTPIGAFQGALSGLTAPQLGATAIAAALDQSGLAGSDIDEAVMGCCLFGGLKQAPARQAVLGAGLPASVPCSTVSKMCGSGMKAALQVHDAILAGHANFGVAGGMESMSNAPYLLSKARAGYRLGHGQVLDHMFHDGLEDAYEGQLMGHYADLVAEATGIGRDRQDAFAAESVRRAQTAIIEGDFVDEIASVVIRGRKGETTIDTDETPGRCDLAKIASVKPVFRAGGTVTAANASSISDGAAALVLANEAAARRRGLVPIARIVASAGFAAAPGEFPTAPIPAIERVLAKAGWSIGEVDLFEVNEAFAVVTLLAMDALDLPAHKVNVLGGACAMGHPIGATGARLLVTLIHALRRRGLKRGVAALCIGGGEATAMAIEIP